MIILRLTIFACIATAIPLSGDEKDALLKEGVKTMHLMWAEVIGKPKLEFDKIPPEKVKEILGRWKGDYIGPCERPEIILKLNENGTWTSIVVGPDMDQEESRDTEQTGHWYLQGGMILLYESPLAKDAELASALFMKDGTLRLLAVMIKDGFVELRKQKDTKKKEAR